MAPIAREAHCNTSLCITAVRPKSEPKYFWRNQWHYLAKSSAEGFCLSCAAVDKAGFEHVKTSGKQKSEG